MSDISDRLEKLSPEKKALLLLRLRRNKAAADGQADGNGAQPPSLQPVNPRPEHIPLSFAQQRLWFINQLLPESPAYNIASAVRLEGPLNVEGVEHVLNRVIARHEALRTTIEEIDGVPFQYVADELRLKVPLIDLRALPEAAREREAQWLATEDATRPFALTGEALIRATILQLAENDHALLLVMHHIISDGWSMGILVREIGTFIQTFITGQPALLPELPVQFADYVLWQRERLQGEVLEQHLNYWLGQLQGAPKRLELPTDYPRPAIQRDRGSVEGIRLSADLVRGLKRLSQEAGATLFMTLLATFKVLLYRYTQQTDIVVGAPVAGRQHEKIEGLIGFFLNTIVLRSDLSGNPQFLALLSQVRNVALGAFAHQELPFEQLLEELKIERDLSHSPLFQVLFVVQNVPQSEFKLPGLTLRTLDYEYKTSKFDLTFTYGEGDWGASASLEFNTDLFEAKTIKRLLAQWKQLLTAVVADPHQRIADLPLLDEAEHHRLLVEWNHRSFPPPPEWCVHEQFAATAEKMPDAVAVAAVNGASSLTYQTLNERANQLAHYLRAQGVGPEIKVGLYAERSPEMIVALLGILKAGGAYIPLDPMYPPERLTYILEDTQGLLTLTQSHLADGLAGTPGRVICLDQAWDAIDQESKENPENVTLPENLAYIIYTSGSTGRPKGVAVSHRSLANYTQWMHETHGIGPDDRVLQFASISFDASAEEIYPCLTGGGTLVLRDDEMLSSAARFFDTCREWEITFLDLPTAFWHQMVDSGEAWTLYEGLKLIILGGERLLLDRLLRWQEQVDYTGRLVNTYGPTEATIVATQCELGTWIRDERLSEVPIGRSVGNVQAYVLDGRLRPVPIGVPGELYLGGAGIARGYLNRPELTAAVFLPNPFSSEKGTRLYKTGDRVRYRANGQLEFLGRVDDQVKVRGFRIELGEIRTALSQHPDVGEVLVIASETRPGDNRLVAYVTGHGEEPPSADELRRFLRQQLPDYMVPSLFVPLRKMPFTSGGKIDRRALPAPDASLQATLVEQFVAPRNPTEEIVANIWADVLGVEQIGVYHNFFEAGGHSLRATQVVARVRAHFEVDLPLRTIFEIPTVAGLALWLNEARQKTAAPPLLPQPRPERLPLSFAQQRLWFLDQLTPESAAYNIPAALRIEGELNTAGLAFIFNQIVARHESLRTVFTTEGGAPYQQIQPQLTLPLAVVDLQGLPAAVQKTEMQRLAQAEATRPFDLSTGPLIRVTVLRLAEADHILLLTMHHIISDGWSVGVLIREIAAFAQSLVAGEPAQLPALPVQYPDYALWQREWLQGEILAEKLAYWQQQFTPLPPILELPTDHPRPAIQSYQGADETHRFSADLTRRLNALSRETGTTLFMCVLAAFKLLLYRYTRQPDIVVGTPVAGRNWVEVEPLIGFFVNTLALRTDLSGNPTFLELLKRVREVSLEAHTHQEVPFERIVEEVGVERSLSHSPLFQVMFVWQNAAAPEVALSQFRLSGLELEQTTAKFDLSLAMAESGDGLAASIEYNTDLFEADSIQRLLNHFQHLLEAITADPAQSIEVFPLLSDMERRQIVETWNESEPDRAVEQCIHQLFEEQAKRLPADPAVYWGEDIVPYGALNRRANQLAAYLRTQGVGPDVLVGICMERTADLVMALLAVLKAGGAYVPLDPTHPPERIRYILSDANASLLLTQESLRPILADQEAQLLYVDREWAAISAASRIPDNLTNLASADNLAYVIYTSGSTGQPKGVAITHRNAVAMLDWAGRAFTGEELRGVAAATTICFDLSVYELFLPLSRGGAVILVEDALALPAAPARDAVTLINTVPSVMLELCRMNGIPESVQTVNLAGEPLKRTLVQQVYRRPQVKRLYNLYGPSEDTTYSTYTLVTREEQAEPTIGRPIDYTQAYILDDRMQPVPIGAVGELYLGGAGVSRGYLNRPKLTAEKYIPDPFSPTPGCRLYRTGDLARYASSGEIIFLGRADFQVKVRGYRIELGEVESVLEQHPAVSEAVTIVREDVSNDKRLVAYVVPQSEREPEAVENLRAFLQQQLPHYMIPSIFVWMDSLPQTPNGKIDRRALPKPQSETSALEEPFVAPRDALEIQLASIWEEVLGVHPIGVNHNFFNLGGHSLLAVRLMATIGEEIGAELPLTMLFQGPTVAQMATMLRQAETVAAASSSLVRIQPGDPDQRPLFFIHPGGGNVFGYAGLARHLGLNRPFYGLQARGLINDEEPLTQIEAMAEHYIQLIRQVQPEGPYYLGGWSMGGIVAFEVAQQLQAVGEAVAAVTIIDSKMPNPHKAPIRLYRPPKQIWQQSKAGHPHLAGSLYPFLFLLYLFTALGKRLARVIQFAGSQGKRIWTKVYTVAMGDYAVEPLENDVNLVIQFAQELFGVPLAQLGLSLKDLLSLPTERQLVVIWEHARAANFISQNVELSQIRRLFHVFETNNRAMEAYAPRPYSGAVLFMRAKDDLPVTKIQQAALNRMVLIRSLIVGVILFVVLLISSGSLGPALLGVAILALYLLLFTPLTIPGSKKIREKLAAFMEFLQDPTEGWGRVTRRETSYMILPGTHYSIIREPHVETVAETINAQWYAGNGELDTAEV